MRIKFHYDEEESRRQGKLVLRQKFVDGAPTHGVIFDEISPTVCHQDGKVYTSKKALEAAYGQTSSVTRKSEEQTFLETRETIEKAYYDLRDNRIPRHQTPSEAVELWRKVERGEL